MDVFNYYRPLIVRFYRPLIVRLVIIVHYRLIVRSYLPVSLPLRLERLTFGLPHSRLGIVEVRFPLLLLFVQLTFGLPHSRLGIVEARFPLLLLFVRLTFGLPHSRLGIVEVCFPLLLLFVRLYERYSSKGISTSGSASMPSWGRRKQRYLMAMPRSRHICS